MVGRVTLSTIADEVGVSKQTVSNAFSRPDQLSATLRQTILDAADRHGYTGPDPSARALSTGSTGVIGVVLTERSADALSDPAATEFLIGVTEALEVDRRNVLLISGRPESQATGSPVADAAVDGLIVYSLSPNDDHLAAALRRSVPIVIVDQPQLDDHPFIGADQRNTTALVADHLVALGHTSVAVLTVRIARDGREGPVDGDRWGDAEFPLTEQRFSGISDGTLTVASVWECPRRQSVAAAVDHIVDHTDATAIVAMSDDFAVAAIEQLTRRGLDVPGDMSVTGIDDIAVSQTVGLTTVHQDHRAKGRYAVAALGEPSVWQPLPVRLVERRSTAPPGSPGP